MRKMRCVLGAALLTIAAAVTVPAAADAPAASPAWTVWWQDLSAWVGRLSPFAARVVASTGDGGETTSGDGETVPPQEGPEPDFNTTTGGGDGGGGDGDGETGPGWDPNG
jgi:hypothetical protein